MPHNASAERDDSRWVYTRQALPVAEKRQRREERRVVSLALLSDMTRPLVGVYTRTRMAAKQ